MRPRSKPQSQVGSPLGSLLDLAMIFLRLGITAFGGPAAHIAMMEREFVERRHWLSSSEFLDMIGTANLVPGPSSTEVAIHIGYRRAGIPGLALAGICFIVPAAAIVCLFAAVYVHLGGLPRFHSALDGIKPVVVAIVAQAVFNLGKKALDTWPKRLVLLLDVTLGWFGLGELPILLGSGLAFGADVFRRDRNWKSAAPIGSLIAGVLLVAAIPIVLLSLKQGPHRTDPVTIFLYFLKLGSVLYGSGYVLLAFLEHDLVVHWHWISKSLLIDAVAVGQFTPGPVFTTATFLGYVLAGPVGAVTATLGIFLPAFLFVFVSGRQLVRLRQSEVSAGFLDGINVGAIALMSLVSSRLAIDALHSHVTILIFSLALVALTRFKINSALLIALGGVIGFTLRGL